jgi:hypothetical protein
MKTRVPIFPGTVTESGIRFEPVHVDLRRAYFRSLVGKPVEIIVRKKRNKRTLDQNSALHVLLTQWAYEEGHEVDDLKRDLLGTVFGWSEKASPLTAQRLPLKPHTSDLSVEEMSFLIERTLQLAAECGVHLESPGEYKERKQRDWKAAS